MFGCYENLIRRFFKATAVWLFAKGTFAFVLGASLDAGIINAVKDNVKIPTTWGKDELSLVWFGAQFLVLAGITLFRTRKCWVSKPELPTKK